MRGGIRSKSQLTLERLKEVLDYDPQTGVFRWKMSVCNVSEGAVAGRYTNGNRYIGIDGDSYTAARLAWFYVKGEWPRCRLRYVNGDGEDLRVGNLAEVSYSSTSKHDFRSKEGRAAYQLEYRSANRQKFRDEARRINFGVTPEWYCEQMAKQDGVCAICKQPETRKRMGLVTQLTVDHNHVTNEVRELLCNACNVLIGYARENVGILQAAIAYLERHNGNGA